jgi:hypothetical protein
MGDNIITECGGADCINLFRDIDYWRDLVNRVMHSGLRNRLGNCSFVSFGLFNDAVNISEYRASKGRIIK